MDYFKNIWNAASSILHGLAVTLSWCFRRPYTIQWPDKIERPLEETLPERFRGLLEVEPRVCTACLACQQACPIDCISITIDKNPETKERLLSRFAIDSAKCMYCGLCSEACPTEALHHTTQFAATTANADELCIEFIPLGAPAVPYKPKDARPDTRPRGSIVRRLLDQGASRPEIKTHLGEGDR